MTKTKSPSKLSSLVRREKYSLWLLLILAALLIIFPLIKGQNVWTGAAVKAMAMQLPEYGVMVLGLVFCFIAGGIDLSFVAVANFTAIIAVMIMNSELGQTYVVPMIIVACLVAVVMGAVVGYLNGMLITGFGIPPILATLATQQVYTGLSKALTGGKSQSLMDSTYSEIGHTSLFGVIPVPFLIFVLCFIVVAVLLTVTVYGEKLYMMGANTKAAHFSAINTKGMTRVTFMIGGIMSSIGGLLMISTYNSAKADYGTSYLMQCILICVLAGISTSGGKGKIGNVFLTIIIVQVISSGVNHFHEINNHYRGLIWGVLLLGMMIFNYLQEIGTFQRWGMLRRRRRARKNAMKSSEN